jgi:hypothetical protein
MSAMRWFCKDEGKCSFLMAKPADPPSVNHLLTDIDPDVTVAEGNAASFDSCDVEGLKILSS